MDGLDGIFGKAVTIPFTAGQHALDVGSHPLEVLVEQGGGGHAVHIVVAKDNNGLLPVNGIEDAGTGLVHVGQEHGVGQLLLARQQGQGLGRSVMPRAARMPASRPASFCWAASVI